VQLNKRFGFLDDGEDKGGLMASLHSYLSYLAPTGVYYEWHPFLYWLNSLRPAKGGMAYLGKFTQDQLAQRQALASEKELEASGMRDFLTKALSMHQADPEKFLMRDVMSTCLTNIGAGSDTTSISLAAICYWLCKSPAAVQKVGNLCHCCSDFTDTSVQLRAEIDEVIGASDRSKLITFQQTQAMPYLQACIKESLRLHPATGLPLSRVVPAGGAMISGQFFPQGVSEPRSLRGIG
jgi:cytochrome P450